MRIMTTAKVRICPDCGIQIEVGEKVAWVDDKEKRADKNVCVPCGMKYKG